MHISSQISMRRCVRRHLLTDQNLSARDNLRVLDVGGADLNGSYRALFEGLGARYLALDISVGPGVDLLLDGNGRIDEPDGAFDVVISGQTIEHCWNFWELFAEMVRVCAEDGLLILIAPSEGHEHRFPIDCYRFLPDSFQALADAHHLRLVDTWRSPFGPFFDLVGVFRKTLSSSTTAPGEDVGRSLVAFAQNDPPTIVDPAHEVMTGRMPARSFLENAHRLLQPRGYLETGVWMGHSLKLAQCPAIGIDPFPVISVELSDHHRVLEVTAEEFFDEPEYLRDFPPVDLSYIDGLHLIENALLDFMNIERVSHPGSVVIIDDVYPNHPVQAFRQRSSKAWTGDVWKILPILREQRQDLLLLPVDTYPTGSLVVIGADPENVHLWKVFDLLMSFETSEYPPTQETLSRHEAIDPHDRLWNVLFSSIRSLRSRPADPVELRRLRTLVEQSLPRSIVSRS